MSLRTRAEKHLDAIFPKANTNIPEELLTSDDIFISIDGPVCFVNRV